MASKFSDKYTTETEPFVFDFSPVLASGETISTADASVSLVSGVDPTPSNILSGSETISGATVTQKITGGVDKCVYRLQLTVVTSASNTYTLVGDLRVVSPTTA